MVRETLAVRAECGADELHVSADWSAYARAREQRLAAACEEERIAFTTHPGITIVEPGAVTPAGGDHFRVFSPYHRAWSQVPPRRQIHGAPRKLNVPATCGAGRLPAPESLTDGELAPDRAPGGESEGRKRMRAFLRDGLGGYDEHHDDLPGDDTSRLSAYLRCGCVSPARARRARPASGAAAPPSSASSPGATSTTRCSPRPRPCPAATTAPAATAGRAPSARSRPGARASPAIPLVDAAMRQLRQEGFMHNRARMTVGSFLSKDLYIDWRAGAWHFWDLLCDGDIANNAGNWQWIAGTGNDTRPNRVLSPVRQAERFDPEGHYVRRYLPELESVAGRRSFGLGRWKASRGWTIPSRSSITPRPRRLQSPPGG